MTEIQRMMLAVCFGGMVGLILADIGILVQELVLHIRDKRRKRKEEKKPSSRASKQGWAAEFTTLPPFPRNRRNHEKSKYRY